MSASLDEILKNEFVVLGCLRSCYDGGGIHYIHFEQGFNATTARIAAIEWVIKQGEEQ